MTSVKAPQVLGDIVTEPIVISLSPLAPPSELINAQDAPLAFLGILTSPERPFSVVAKGKTAELFLKDSIKSPAR